MQIIKLIKLIRKTFITNYRRTYYSQFGEDTILRELINKKKKGIYVDVGCYHPKKFSNTYFLYKKGWHGVNIDLEEDKVQLFKLARPKDHNVVAAVSDVASTAIIYKDRDFSLGTTINRENSNTMSHVVTIEIQTKTLDEILKNTPYADKELDLLSIDCEGNDYKVLRSINLEKYKPKIIIIEDQSKDIDRILKSDIYSHLIEKNYALRSWMHLSLIFVLKDGPYAK